MIAKVFAFAALFGAAISAPVTNRQVASNPIAESIQSSIVGMTSSGAGFSANGPAAAGATVGGGSSIAGSVLSGQTGTTIGVVGAGTALGAAVASPSL